MDWQIIQVDYSAVSSHFKNVLEMEITKYVLVLSSD